MALHASVGGMTVALMSDTEMTGKDERYPWLSFPQCVQFSLGINTSHFLETSRNSSSPHSASASTLIRFHS